MQVLMILFWMTDIKKPGGAADDIEKYFGCSASNLVMVIFQKPRLFLFLFLWVIFNYSYCSHIRWEIDISLILFMETDTDF